jgi:hypothetical protein
MKITLDDNALEIETPTLAEGLRQAVAAAESQGRVVIEATLDGCPLTDEQLADPPEDASPEADLRLVSANPVALVRATLYEAADALDEAARLQTKAADLIERGESEDAMDILSEILTVWQAVSDVANQGPELLGKPFETADGSASLDDNIEKLGVCLGEVKRCLKLQDWASLADLLAFDMGELGQAWKVQLHAFADELKVD